MSRQALEVMLKGIVHYKDLAESAKMGTGETLGDIYRAESIVAPHIVQLTVSGVKQQLINMTTDPNGLNLQNVPAAVYDRMAKTVHDNIKSHLEKKFKWQASNQSFYISGTKDNFAEIREAFSAAFGGKKAYGPFFDFLIKYLREDINVKTNDLAVQVENFQSNLLSGTEVMTAEDQAKETQKRMKGYGFDVGHLEANVTAAFKAAMWNEVKESVKDGSLIDFNSDPAAAAIIAKDLERLENEWLKLIANPVGKGILFKQLQRYGVIKGGETGEAIVSGFFKHTIGFMREVLNRDVKATVVVESHMENTSSFEKVAREAVISIIPEYGKFNQDKGSKLEQAILRHLKIEADAADKKLITYLNIWLQGNLSNAPKLDMMPGSPSIFKLIGDTVYDNFKTGNSKNVKYAGNATKNAKVKTGKGIPAKLGRRSNISLPKGSVPSINVERATEQAKAKNPTSIINIVNLINMKLAETIRQNMGSPRLNYRTGRFAKSATVLPGMMDKDGALRLPYTYMKYPYQTFEPGFARGSVARDPKVVIGESIKELAIRLVLMKMRVVRV